MATFESYTANDDGAVGEDGSSGVYTAQTFTMRANANITQIKVKIYKTGTPSNGICRITAVDANGQPTGSNLAFGTITSASVTADSGGAWYTITLSVALDVTKGTKYAIIVVTDHNATNHYNWRVDASSPAYTRGNREHTTDGGSNWTAHIGSDFLFEVVGSKSFTPPDDVVTYKCLVVAGNNEIWYEDI